MCEHEWVMDKNWRDGLIIGDDVIRIPVTCHHCGKKAFETWSGWIYTDRDTGEQLD